MSGRSISGDQRGQAAVEFVAALPLLLVLLACGWQIVVAGHAWWSLSEAARTAARRVAVVRRESGEGVARTRAERDTAALLPAAIRGGRSVIVTTDGAVEVRARVPLVQPFAAVFGDGPAISARAGFR